MQTKTFVTYNNKRFNMPDDHCVFCKYCASIKFNNIEVYHIVCADDKPVPCDSSYLTCKHFEEGYYHG